MRVPRKRLRVRHESWQAIARRLEHEYPERWSLREPRTVDRDVDGEDQVPD